MEFIKKHKSLAIGTAIWAGLILMIAMISNMDALGTWFEGVMRMLRPLLIGLAVAYMCNPFFRFYERRLFSGIRPIPLRRGCALFCTYLTLFSIIAILLMLIFPQLIDSISNFFGNYETMLEKSVNDLNGFVLWLNGQLPDGSSPMPLLDAESIKVSVREFFASIKLDQSQLAALVYPDIIGSIVNIAGSILSILGDVVFGLFISLYLLSTKEKRYAQVMRMRHALFDEKVNAAFTRICTVADQSFGGFFKGKLVDSAIVGVLVYLTISLFQIPYAPLIAVVIAITDIVPIVGPFIGVIPSAVIILLTDPTKVIPFLLIILIIQQIDGNIIAPKILGEHTGVSSLCVIIAIAVMGSLFGFFGMLLGVPLFATILELSSAYLDNRLKKKGLPVETAYYADDALEPEKDEAEKGKRFRSLSQKLGLSPSATGGGSDISDLEQMQLKTYELAKKHRIFASSSEENLARFAAETATLRGGRKQAEDESANEQKSPTENTAATDECEPS